MIATSPIGNNKGNGTKKTCIYGVERSKTMLHSSALCNQARQMLCKKISERLKIVTKSYVKNWPCRRISHSLSPVHCVTNERLDKIILHWSTTVIFFVILSSAMKNFTSIWLKIMFDLLRFCIQVSILLT